MAFYAIRLLPLIQDLKDLQMWLRVCYADDSNCAGMLELLCIWLDTLILKGLIFGHYPEPSKSVTVVASEFVQEAQDLFYDLGVLVTTSHRLLGGHIGSAEGCSEFVKRKVDSSLAWSDCASRLADLAVQQPQQAYHVR